MKKKVRRNIVDKQKEMHLYRLIIFNIVYYLWCANAQNFMRLIIKYLFSNYMLMLRTLTSLEIQYEKIYILNYCW